MAVLGLLIMTYIPETFVKLSDSIPVSSSLMCNERKAWGRDSARHECWERCLLCYHTNGNENSVEKCSVYVEFYALYKDKYYCSKCPVQVRIMLVLFKERDEERHNRWISSCANN